LIWRPYISSLRSAVSACRAVFNRGFTDRSAATHGAVARIRNSSTGKQIGRHWSEDAALIVLGIHELPFTVAGPKGSVLKLYGQEVNLFKLGRMPAQLIVDKSGKVRFVHYGHAMSDIPDNAELLALLDDLNAEKVINSHLEEVIR
jgi:hypothetical protein